MKIKFLGTGSADRMGEIFCFCDVCKATRENMVEIRSNSQLLINDDLLIDFPSDTYMKSLEYNVNLSAIKNLLITHSHADHLYHNDLHLRKDPYAYNMTYEKLNIYSNSAAKKILDDNFESNDTYISFLIDAFKPYKIGNYTVTAVHADHDDCEECFLYIIDDGSVKLLYATDTSIFPADTFDFLERYGHIDVVIYDCTGAQGEKLCTHLSVEYDNIINVKLKELKVVDENTKVFMTHISHRRRPFQKLVQEAGDKYGFTAAYDGMEINI